MNLSLLLSNLPDCLCNDNLEEPYNSPGPVSLYQHGSNAAEHIRP